MKVKLLRDSRINHAAGEIVEVSPATADFLLSVGSAVKIESKSVEAATIPVEEVAEKAVKAPKATAKTTTKRTTTKK
ncbi:MAG: hypothetical protein IIY21_18835 [Clostridiales bacterium]|jgi:hypothetical protein|nr:hypothetical protein [Clostridiales bacterium]